jgi:hypothetical protein
MQLEVIQVKNETRPNKNGNGSYQMLEVAYKNLKDGKVGAKKLMSFNDKVVFSTFAEAKSGDIFEVTSEKKGDFWEWTAASRGQGPSAPSATSTGVNKAPKSTYETPEERARRQVYIMKQSSVSSAIALLGTGAKAPPALTDVLKTAQEIYNWVSTTQLEEMLDDIPFDVPEVQ